MSPGWKLICRPAPWAYGTHTCSEMKCRYRDVKLCTAFLFGPITFRIIEIYAGQRERNKSESCYKYYDSVQLPLVEKKQKNRPDLNL